MTFTPTTNLADGLHAVSASVADRAGNVSSLSSSFTTDTTPPTVPVLSGVSEGQILSGPVSLGAAATDATSGVARFDVFADGSSILTLTAPAFAGTWNTAVYAEGSHALTVRAVDAASNVSPLGQPVHVTINNRPTTISIGSPSANTRFRDAANVTA